MNIPLARLRTRSVTGGWYVHFNYNKILTYNYYGEIKRTKLFFV